jgi:hypothetical protein
MRFLAALSAILGALAADPASASMAQAEQPAAVSYCHGYGCKQRTTVRFSAADMSRMKAIVAAGAGTAAAEREALGKADQFYEKIAGAQSGTSNDERKGSFGDAYNGAQLDCIDESTNTTTLLKLIESRGWLKHHKVGRPKARGFLLDLRYPHNTAVVIETASGQAWAIDSWIPANAEFPDIMPLSVWLTKGVRGRD